MRDFGNRLVNAGFSFAPAPTMPTYFVNAAGISTLDYLFFNPGIEVGRVTTHLYPKISHAAISTRMKVPFPEQGSFLLRFFSI
jgi:hypothetical protein